MSSKLHNSSDLKWKLCFNVHSTPLKVHPVCTLQCKINACCVNIKWVMQMLLGNLLRVSTCSFNIQEHTYLLVSEWICKHLSKPNDSLCFWTSIHPSIHQILITLEQQMLLCKNVTKGPCNIWNKESLQNSKHFKTLKTKAGCRCTLSNAKSRLSIIYDVYFLALLLKSAFD